MTASTSDEATEISPVKSGKSPVLEQTPCAPGKAAAAIPCGGGRSTTANGSASCGG
jgi:hypothetical protein